MPSLLDRVARPIVMLFPLLGLSGCATTDGPALGETATLRPGWARLQQAFNQAVRDPKVWAPMLAAALLQIDDWDEDISDRLREDTPLFGSSEDAERASDDLRDLTAAAYLGTALIAPVSEQENVSPKSANMLSDISSSDASANRSVKEAPDLTSGQVLVKFKK